MQDEHELRGGRSRRWLSFASIMLAFLVAVALALCVGFSIGLLATTKGGNLIAFGLLTPAMLLWLRSIFKEWRAAKDV